MTSYMGCIGHIMAGSGLQDVLEQFFAGNAVGHMQSEKVVEWAIRRHFSIDASLNAMLLSNVFNIDLAII